MLDEIVPVLKNFRDRLYRFFPARRDAAMELIDALSSNRTADNDRVIANILLNNRTERVRAGMGTPTLTGTY